MIKPETMSHADGELNALLNYTESFFAAAIKHGLPAQNAADIVAHVEKAARRLHALVAQAENKSDEEMLRVKACEHIADGDEGWRKLRMMCPSAAAVAALRDKYERLASLAGTA